MKRALKIHRPGPTCALKRKACAPAFERLSSHVQFTNSDWLQKPKREGTKKR